MDTNWLEDFVCFARLLSFTAAASERNVTQSAFSRRIQSLEMWVGVDLVDRKSYPARLSKAGEDFLPTAKTMLMQLYRTRDGIRANASLGHDMIGFAAPHTVSIHYLSPLLQRLEIAEPGLKTKVLSDDLHTCCEYLAEEVSDFLVCYRHSHVPITLDEQRFQRIDLFDDKLIPVVSSAAVKAGKSDRNKFPQNSLLSGSLPYLAFPSGSFLGTVVDEILANNKVELNAHHIDAFSEAIKSRALLGAGLAWLPKTAVQNELSNDELFAFEDERWTTNLTLSVYVDKKRLSPSAEKVWRWLNSEVAG